MNNSLNKHHLLVNHLKYLKVGKDAGGFTLLELLVVIIIISILSAIALPSFLNSSSKAKQSEAKIYVGAINRAQQAYFLENNALVTTKADLGKLGLNIPSDTANYDYDINPIENGAIVIAKPKEKTFKGYAGAVGLIRIASEQYATATQLCESKESGAVLTNASVAVVVGTSTTAGSVTCNPAETVAAK